MPTTQSSVLATPRANVAAFKAVSATPLSQRSQQKQRELALLAANRRNLAAVSVVKSSVPSTLSLKTTSGAAVDMAALSQNKQAKDSAREQIRRLQEQLNGLMANLTSPSGAD